MIDILKPMKERCSPLEDRKSSTFFKNIDAIANLGGTPLVRHSNFIFIDDLEVEVSNLKDRWAGKFHNLSYFMMKTLELGQLIMLI